MPSKYTHTIQQQTLFEMFRGPKLAGCFNSHAKYMKRKEKKWTEQWYRRKNIDYSDINFISTNIMYHFLCVLYIVYFSLTDETDSKIFQTSVFLLHIYIFLKNSESGKFAAVFL